MNILIVEDNEINRRVATKVAISLGHTVDTVVNGLEAVKATAEGCFDAVLMDVQMPIMDGLEATRRIVAETPSEERPHIIAITANAVIGDRDACLEAGMDDYLAKPLRIELLRIALSKVPCEETQEEGESGGLIDREQFDAIVDPEDDECLEIFKDFCQLGLGQIDELLKAAEGEDWQRVQDVAHQLKGSSSTFGFVRFSELAARIEDFAKGDPKKDSDIAFDDLTKLFKESARSVGEDMP